MVSVEGPFGPAHLQMQLPTTVVEEMYRRKCDADVDFSTLGVNSLDLFEGERTGMRFCRPERVADEASYQQLSRKWPFYY